MALPTAYVVAIEFSTGSYTNVTLDVRAFSVERRIANLFQPLTAAELIAEFDNWSGNFSPSNSGSAYGNGALKPNINMRVQATHQSSTRTMFTGKIDRISVNPGISDPRRATIFARDSVKGLFERTVTTSAFSETPVSSIFAAVLSLTAVSSFFVATDLN